MLNNLYCYLFSLAVTIDEQQMPKNVNNHFLNCTSHSSLVTASAEWHSVRNLHSESTLVLAYIYYLEIDWYHWLIADLIEFDHVKYFGSCFAHRILRIYDVTSSLHSLYHFSVGYS